MLPLQRLWNPLKRNRQDGNVDNASSQSRSFLPTITGNNKAIADKFKIISKAAIEFNLRNGR